MSNLRTNVELTGRLYLWRVNKTGRRCHILNPKTERTYCQVENCGGKSFDGRGAEIPPGRRLCGNCIDLAGRNEANYQEPSLAVLLGERLADVEPELFAVVSASRPRKRAKQARPVNRSKGRKTRRGEVKYPRPFNDDLPW